jgi:hypothetical protein
MAVAHFGCGSAALRCSIGRGKPAQEVRGESAVQSKLSIKIGRFPQNSCRLDVNVRILDINVRLFPGILSEIYLFSYTYWLRSSKVKILFFGLSSAPEFYLLLLQLHTGRKRLSAGFFASDHFPACQPTLLCLINHLPPANCHLDIPLFRARISCVNFAPFFLVREFTKHRPR